MSVRLGASSSRPVHRQIPYAVVISLLPVPAAEMLNSGIEALVDRLWPGRDEVAGRIKDMGSAAVFLLMLNVLVVWGVILGSRAW